MKGLLVMLAASAALLLYSKRASANINNTAAADTGGGLLTGVMDMLQNQIGTPRGIRNNNPGNIRLGQNWQGMAAHQNDPSFVQFISPEYGIRAINKILDSYARRGITTLQGIIYTWAPPTENATGAYVDAVASDMGVSVDTVITADLRPLLIAAIIHHENGQQPYDLAKINTGVLMA